ncbi:MAG: hypothetical protein AABX80_02825 [Nanoarchaeota archaeon]
MKILEEITWDGEDFVNTKGKIVNPIPISSPISTRIGISEKNSKVNYYINNCIPKTSKEYLEANAYCVGTRENNDEGSPVQFYKI